MYRILSDCASLMVRDEEELNRIVQYVLYNPVKAELVKRWDGEWKYCKMNF